ncbi:MAG: DNA gyrase/topoisomerase IV subunit A [bacterium]|nr:DNA gyrase/topoisomerase IV subunit A [bacterium]
MSNEENTTNKNPLEESTVDSSGTESTGIESTGTTEVAGTDNSVPGQELDKPTGDDIHHVKHISGMYKNWFLDYASYVILERAVPYIYDGLKPVQRRILHAMKRLDDGRYNKVANIIGFTMQYHPHGDASIGDALVSLGQKDLLIDPQGNWGNIYTGDRAAAPRYIEARLSKFALDVVFNPKVTDWKLSYDGRNNEPVNLPVKFPLLLAQGVEGIAVGLASKILPHNFIELIDACIACLKGEEFELLPDFPTGGMADCSRYNDGLSGGKIRVRAKISKLDKKTLIITQLPYGRTTSSLIDSILSANEKGKIKIKKIDDNTADKVEILVHLPTGVSSDQTIDGLYAFSDCELSISPNSCIIEEKRPRFVGVSEMLKITANNTVNILRRELEIRREELEDNWHKSSLEKIFIENRIYNDIEDCETWDSIIETIDKGLEPFKKLLRREVVYDDIVRLTEIKIKRISKYDAFKADEYLKSIEAELEKVAYNLEHIIAYSIDYYQRIKEKYGAGKERKTELRSFDVIQATKVVAANQKLYVNHKEGFVGTSLKKDEFVGDCSDIDDVIAFLKDGKYVITKVSSKTFVGKDILYAGIFKKNDQRTIYNIIYRDGRDGNTMIKRFPITGVTRDKVYDVTKGTEGSKILYLTANPNGEAETIKVTLKPRKRLRNLKFEVEFSEQAIKGRGSMGNILSKNPVYRIDLKESGVSTLGGRHIWFDADVMRLNADQRGEYLGEFHGDDKIVAITKSGSFVLHGFDLSTYFEPDVFIVEKYNQKKAYTAVYYDGEQKFYYLKRFQVESTEKLSSFIGEHPDSKLEVISAEAYPRIQVTYSGKRKKDVEEIVDAEEFIAVKGYKARGKRLSTTPIDSITQLEPTRKEEPEEGEQVEGGEAAKTDESAESVATEPAVKEPNPADKFVDTPIPVIEDKEDLQKSLFDFPKSGDS